MKRAILIVLLVGMFLGLAFALRAEPVSCRECRFSPTPCEVCRWTPTPTSCVLCRFTPTPVP